MNARAFLPLIKIYEMFFKIITLFVLVFFQNLTLYWWIKLAFFSVQTGASFSTEYSFLNPIKRLFISKVFSMQFLINISNAQHKIMVDFSCLFLFCRFQIQMYPKFPLKSAQTNVGCWIKITFETISFNACLQETHTWKNSSTYKTLTMKD